jgi:hypothetical protein
MTARNRARQRRPQRVRTVSINGTTYRLNESFLQAKASQTFDNDLEWIGCIGSKDSMLYDQTLAWSAMQADVFFTD